MSIETDLSDADFDALLNQAFAEGELQAGISIDQVAQRYPQAQVSAEIEAITAKGRIRHKWTAEDEAALKQHYGYMARSKLAKRLTELLRQRTADPTATRTVEGVTNKAQAMGLVACTASAEEMTLKDASRWIDLPYDLLHRALQAGELSAPKRGKYKYVHRRDLALFLVAYRAKQEAQAEVLNFLDGQDTLTKRDAMALAGLSETHLTRYLTTGVIASWRIPDLGEGKRGEWAIERASLQTYIQAQREGRLKRLLDANPAYVALRNKLTAKIRTLRRTGRLKKCDPLTDPQSHYHPGCFTVKQVASHTRLSAQVLYTAIKRGTLTAVSAKKGGRPRYAIEPAEAHRFARWVKERDPAAARWHNRRRREIAEAGLLTVRELIERWDVSPDVIGRWIRHGKKGSVLASRTWGRYLVFEVADVEQFEQTVGLSIHNPQKRGTT